MPKNLKKLRAVSRTFCRASLGDLPRAGNMSLWAGRSSKRGDRIGSKGLPAFVFWPPGRGVRRPRRTTLRIGSGA